MIFLWGPLPGPPKFYFIAFFTLLTDSFRPKSYLKKKKKCDDILGLHKQITYTQIVVQEHNVQKIYIFRINILFLFDAKNKTKFLTII